MNVINNTAKVAVIGLGKMGLPMAINLVKAGFEVMGYDPTLNAREELVYKGGKLLNQRLRLQRVLKLSLPCSLTAL